MAFRDKIRVCGVTALCGMGLWGASVSGEAQVVKVGSGPRPKPVSRSQAIVERVFSIPGRGLVKMRFLRLSKDAVKRVASGPQPRFTSGTPILYSSASNYTAVGDGFAGEPDALWTFPSIGFAAPQVGQKYGIPNSLDLSAPVNLQFADVALGEIGSASRVTEVFICGGMADAGTFTPQAGTVFIALFDGVSQTTPPSGSNVAHLLNKDANNNFIDGISFTFTAANGFGYYKIATTANPFVLNNARGQFGIMVAKESGGTPTTAWIGYVNSPNGPNATYQVTDGNFSTASLSFYPSDSLFNQGAANFGAYNYFFELHGTKADGTASARGTLQGNIRRRGFNPPTLPIGSAQNPESAPGCYLVTAYQPGTNTIVRQDTLFTQPSYDSTGKLNDGTGGTSPNYKLEGYPAGTYDIEFRQVPIYNGMPLDSAHRDTIWDPTLYPFADWVLRRVPNVTIANGVTTTLNTRLERLGDIDDGSATNTPDGLVEFADLTALAIAYNTMTGDALFNPAADLVGDPTNPMNPQGFPDGLVEFADLTALAIMYNTGNFEQP